MRSRNLPFLPAFLPGAVLAQSAPPAVPDAGAGLVQVVLGLVVVVAALVVGLWLLKRVTAPQGGAGGALRVVAGTAVGARERVVLIEIGETWLVLGVAPGQVSALHQMPRQTLPGAPTPPAGKDFGVWLKQIMERKNAR